MLYIMVLQTNFFLVEQPTYFRYALIINLLFSIHLNFEFEPKKTFLAKKFANSYFFNIKPLFRKIPYSWFKSYHYIKKAVIIY